MRHASGSSQRFFAAAKLAQELHQPYALGIHPLFVPQAEEQDLVFLAKCIDSALAQDDKGQRVDARLVALGGNWFGFFCAGFV